MKTKNKTLPLSCVVILVFVAGVCATEFHVSTKGNDTNPGTKKSPIRTIQHAADLAKPGDVVTVHEGVYREHVNPPRGGLSDSKRITYQAAAGEKVAITGSEPVRGWEKVENDTWKIKIPNSFFGKFNPYSNIINGDYFCAYGPRTDHTTGCVYLNSDWLLEAEQLDDVLKPSDGTPLWFATVEGTVEDNSTSKSATDNTIIHAQFPGVNPNESNVEINVRQTVFTPEKIGINYITVSGFDLRNAATPWAPPTAGQIGLVSAYWCKGWIIENNEISYSKCCGIALGKYSDEWDNRSENNADAYTDAVKRALVNGWNKDTVGSHIVRNNLIHHCEQTGIVGSLGCSFSTVTGNVIRDIRVQQQFSGAEMGGIKFHGAIDVVISGNHIYNCGDDSGIWLDWMSQGSQVTCNLLHDNFGKYGDMILEMQHGPILVANNLLLSKGISVYLEAVGIAFAHNLIAGSFFLIREDDRVTPFHMPHSTKFAGLHPSAKGIDGDHRFYNNLLLASCNLHEFDSMFIYDPVYEKSFPSFFAGNVCTKGSLLSAFDTDALRLINFDPGVKLTKKTDGWYLELIQYKSWRDKVKRKLVTTELLGKAKVTGCAYENRDGSPLRINTDFFGNKRDEKNPFPGPFEILVDGKQEMKVWPIDSVIGRRR